MTRLYRPHIPWSVRARVLERQMAEAHLEPSLGAKYSGSDERRCRFMIEELFGPGVRVELHHRPALVNRHKQIESHSGKIVSFRYVPDANNPDFLVYLLAGKGEDHDVETRVRGQHGQHSDLALARKRKRKERKAKREKFNRKTARKMGYRWPSRPLRSRNDLRRRP